MADIIPPPAATFRPFRCTSCGSVIAEIVGHGRQARLLIVSDDAEVLIPGHTDLTCRKCGAVNQWRRKRTREKV